MLDHEQQPHLSYTLIKRPIPVSVEAGLIEILWAQEQAEFDHAYTSAHLDWLK